MTIYMREQKEKKQTNKQFCVNTIGRARRDLSISSILVVWFELLDMGHFQQY